MRQSDGPISSTVEVGCPLCGKHDGRFWGAENGFTALKCANCALVYVSPRPDDTQISEATKVGQHRGEVQQLDFVYQRSTRKVHRYGKLVRAALAKAMPHKPVSWLDIGAGFGELIEALQAVLPNGSDILGIEPMGPKAREAQKRGLPISSQSLHAIDRQFDYVSLINVLSHLPDPRAFLAEIAPLVRPGGTLMLVTGNGGDLEHAGEYPDRLDLPDHLLFAGRTHVERFLKDSGFAVYKVQERRVDTPIWAAKSLAKRVLGRRVPIAIPLRSPFRDMLYLARRES